ncbi:MAG: class I SAM-dependent methyltransferase [Myxococcales bacterium]|nr:class I SAM-dependent methyltransferase [Myxococcales bacterium]
MIRALAKGAAQAAFGWAPGGPAAYRALTRGHLGTFASHVDKVARVWPGYAAVWQARCGVTLEGARLAVLDGGETPVVPLAAYLLTGAGGVVLNRHGGMLDRYLAHARAGVLAAAWPEGLVPAARRRVVDALRWEPSVGAALAAVGATVHTAVETALPVATASVDLLHSGGALEHYAPAALDALIAEMRRVVRPGGVISHVVDHRDHLHHGDRRLPFLAHLALPDPVYRAVVGHPVGFHNRLAPAEVHARFVAAGLTPIALRRLIYVDGARPWVDDDAAAMRGTPGLAPRWLAPRFRGVAPVDLRTAAAHYLFRRS